MSSFNSNAVLNMPSAPVNVDMGLATAETAEMAKRRCKNGRNKSTGKCRKTRK